LTTLLRADLEGAVEAAAEAGFEAVELWVDSLERFLATHTVDDLRALLERHRMKVVSIGDIESITFCTREQFEELSQNCERLAAVARAVSCPSLVVSASVKPRGVDASAIAAEASSALGRLLDVVEPAGVGLAFAFRGFGWCAVNSLAQVRDAVDSHAGRHVGLALDTFDLHTRGVQPAEIATVNPEQIFVMRMSDCNEAHPLVLTDSDRVLPGEGVVQLDNMLEAVWKAGFSGPVSLKILCPRLWELSAPEAAQLVMATASQYSAGLRTG